MNKNKGFTLIELLVVIAIIGVLASVVLASLNSARNKGIDAAVRSNLSNARAQAEIFYDNANTYVNVCGSGTNAIGPAVLAAIRATNSTGTVSILTTQTATTATCNHFASSWVAQAPLKSVSGHWCVDSSGNSRQNGSLLLGTANVCP